MSLAEDVKLGFTVLCAADMHSAAPANVTPPVDPRLLAWKVHGYIVGIDALWRQNALEVSAGRVFYGLLLESVSELGTFVVAIRGTNGLIEWAEDGEFGCVPHPLGGHAEAGFWSVYSSLRLILADGTDQSVVSGIADIVKGGSVTVVGHSLGAALACYLTLDLAETPRLKVRGRFFACPRPGDLTFSTLFDRTVADYQTYAYTLDVVPHVPLGFGYAPLRRCMLITPATSQARIAFGVDCSHHLTCYLAQLQYDLTDWTKMPLIDQCCAGCIKGPSHVGTP